MRVIAVVGYGSGTLWLLNVTVAMDDPRGRLWLRKIAVTEGCGLAGLIQYVKGFLVIRRGCSHRCDRSSNGGMRRLVPRRSRRGVTLLLTLIVLIVLAATIVQFQADASLQMRSSSHRVEMLRCRYAAESGIVMGQVMIKDVIDKNRAFYTLARTGKTLGEDDISGWNRFELPDETPLDPNLLALGLSEAELAAMGLSDPNLLSSEDPGLFEPAPSYTGVVVGSVTTDIGGVTVTIEVHDEDAKFPVLWLLSSPFGRSRSGPAEKALKTLADQTGVDEEVAENAVEVIRRVGKPLNLPPPTVTVQSSSGTSRKRGRSRRALGLDKQMAEMRDRRRLMGVFAHLFQADLLHNPESAELASTLLDGEAMFPELLGLWGNNQINLNTASPELLEGALESIGMTHEMARAIVIYRNEQPFTHVVDLKKIDAVNRDTLDKMRRLCKVLSDTFSIHVTARLGRTECRLFSGLYKNRKGVFLNMGVVPAS